MPKKPKKRVSFVVPENRPNDDEVENQGITISINEDPIDEDVETIEDHVESDSEESDSSGGAAYRDEKDGQKAKRRREQKLKISRNKYSECANEQESRDLDTISKGNTGKHVEGLSSEDHKASESGSELDSGSDDVNSLSAGSEADAGADSEIAPDSDAKGDEGSSETGSETESSDDDDEEEEPEPQTRKEEDKREKAPTPVSTFSEMGLDPRVERAIERMGWRKPTPVQSAVIPAAMAGRDVLVSAPTGSGKTAAYAIPILQQLCRSTVSRPSGIRCVILVPTRELVHQVATIMKRMCKYVDGIHVGNLAGKEGRKGRRESSFSRASDILVATPSALVAAIAKDEKSPLIGIEFVVVDEADLVLSYGYEDDTRAALSKIPKTAQSILLSATLEGEGMDKFRKVVLRRPLTIKVTADDNIEDGDQTGATHYYARLKSHKDRYLVTYAMLRLNVICGKVLIFVNHINTAFRLKLFLDQFRLKPAVLNSELPANSRRHCVEQFNAGIFEILIATDESKQNTGDSRKDETKMKKGGKKRKRVEKDEEFGLSRGVDFNDVAAVFNFDIPETVSRYTHRAGRTARAGKSGTVLTLVCQDKEEMTVLDMGRNIGAHIGPLAFRMDQIEALRYRVESSLRLVTDTAVHGARLADVRREIVNSEALKDYFDDNPQDLDALQHNLSLAKRIPEHLGHLPSYLLPPALRGNINNQLKGRRFKPKRHRKSISPAASDQKRRTDPLKSFSTSGVAGSSRHRYRTKHGITTKKKDLGRVMKKRRRTY